MDTCALSALSVLVCASRHLHRVILGLLILCSRYTGTCRSIGSQLRRTTCAVPGDPHIRSRISYYQISRSPSLPWLTSRTLHVVCFAWTGQRTIADHCPTKFPAPSLFSFAKTYARLASHLGPSRCSHSIVHIIDLPSANPHFLSPVWVV